MYSSYIEFFSVLTTSFHKFECLCCTISSNIGSYQVGPGSYKDVYFNTTATTFKIWLLTMTAVVMFYEAVKKIVKLILRGRLRYSMFVLFLSVMYSHYFTWWNFFNYLNDDYDEQWNHQVFFSLTELISTAVVLHLCERNNVCKPRLLFLILNIATVHILTSGVDQFLENVLFSRGASHQIVRDLGLMFADILHVVIPLWEVGRYAESINRGILDLVTVPDAFVFVFLTWILYCICMNL